jgi:hypothetical protein
VTSELLDKPEVVKKSRSVPRGINARKGSHADDEDDAPDGGVLGFIKRVVTRVFSRPDLRAAAGEEGPGVLFKGTVMLRTKLYFLVQTKPVLMELTDKARSAAHGHAGRLSVGPDGRGAMRA